MFCIVVQIFVRTHHAMANNTLSAVAIDTPNVATIASLVVIALESANKAEGVFLSASSFKSVTHFFSLSAFSNAAQFSCVT
jgi:hypothetical protein